MQSQNLAVSLTPVKDACASVMTQASNFSAVLLTTVKYSKTAKASLSGVIDISETFLPSVINASDAWFFGVVDTDEPPK